MLYLIYIRGALQEVRSFHGHADVISDVCFAGKTYVCSASLDNLVSVWNREDGHRWVTHQPQSSSFFSKVYITFLQEKLLTRECEKHVVFFLLTVFSSNKSDSTSMNILHCSKINSSINNAVFILTYILTHQQGALIKGTHQKSPVYCLWLVGKVLGNCIMGLFGQSLEPCQRRMCVWPQSGKVRIPG